MRKTHVLIASIGVGAAIGGFTLLAISAGTGGARAVDTNGPAAAAAPAPSADPAPAAAAPGEVAVEGEVLETIDVPGYTYLRIGTGGEESWAAVPTTAQQKGAHVRVIHAMRMTNFKSSKLDRTFPSIWFGQVDDGSGQATAPPAGFMPRPNSDKPGQLPPGHPPIGANNPHAQQLAPAADIGDTKVERAPNGKTVAEIIGQRTDLAGKPVRVRAIVVKATAKVLGHNYLHLRDGSGDAASSNNDLVATTDAEVKVGDTVLLEGKVGVDRDLGQGYKFATILDDAKVVPQ